MNAEQFDWFVGLPVGLRTRVCYDAPFCQHPLTPKRVRDRYAAEIRNSAVVIWHLPRTGVGGVRAGIDEAAWLDVDIVNFETSFCRPGKGAGYVRLAAQLNDGKILDIVLSDHYESAAHEWHLAVASFLEEIYSGCTCIRDEGYDV